MLNFGRHQIQFQPPPPSRTLFPTKKSGRVRKSVFGKEEEELGERLSLTKNKRDLSAKSSFVTEERERERDGREGGREKKNFFPR